MLYPEELRGVTKTVEGFFFLNILFYSSTNLFKNSSQVCSAQFDLHNHVGDYEAPLEFSKRFVHKGPLNILL